MIQDKARPDTAPRRGTRGWGICDEAQDVQKENGQTAPFNQVCSAFSET